VATAGAAPQQRLLRCSNLGSCSFLATMCMRLLEGRRAISTPAWANSNTSSSSWPMRQCTTVTVRLPL
jgi:hypothetical protein